MHNMKTAHDYSKVVLAINIMQSYGLDITVGCPNDMGLEIVANNCYDGMSPYNCLECWKQSLNKMSNKLRVKEIAERKKENEALI